MTTLQDVGSSPTAERVYSSFMSLIVTGTIGIDTGHTPTGKAEGVSGGSCAYFAAAASFHAPVRIVAAVGGDWPNEHRTILESFDNVCMAGLETRPDRSHDPRDPMTENEIAVKFNALGKDVVGEERCNELGELIMGIEGEATLDRVFELTRA